jgi:hypothetical protein
LHYVGAKKGHGLNLTLVTPRKLAISGQNGALAQFDSPDTSGTNTALRFQQPFFNSATGVFDGQDRRRRDEDGERERGQVC